MARMGDKIYKHSVLVNNVAEKDNLVDLNVNGG